MLNRIVRAVTVSAAMLPAAALAHPSGHDGLGLSELGSHMAGDPFHLLMLGGVIGAGLLWAAAVAVSRVVAARRHPDRRR